MKLLKNKLDPHKFFFQFPSVVIPCRINSAVAHPGCLYSEDAEEFYHHKFSPAGVDGHTHFLLLPAFS